MRQTGQGSTWKRACFRRRHKKVRARKRFGERLSIMDASLDSTMESIPCQLLLLLLLLLLAPLHDSAIRYRSGSKTELNELSRA